jgi:hypothetical protein
MKVTVTTTATSLKDLLETAGYNIFWGYSRNFDVLIRNNSSNLIYFDFENITPTSSTSDSIWYWDRLSFNEIDLSRFMLVAWADSELLLAIIKK